MERLISSLSTYRKMERPEGLNKGFKFYKGTCLWENAEPERFPSFPTKDSDIWICSFPRSGTTLVQEMTYLIRTQNYSTAASSQLDLRVPYADVVNNDLPFYKGLDGIAQMVSPRMVKTHLHYHLLPDDIKAGHGKIIYVARNPKASVPSLYRLLNFLKTPVADSLPDFVDLFLENKVLGCPWGLHVREYWEHSADNNLLFLQYERIVKNKEDTIRQIAEFLGVTLTTADVNQIAELTSIEHMRNNAMVNFSFQQQAWKMETSNNGAFINTGTVDGWKDELPAELQQRIDDMVKDKLSGTPLFTVD